MKSLTVFTPTYNRKHTLPRTYESLCGQTSLDFDWLVIDDGSSDGTREWIESLGSKICNSGQKFDWMGRKLSEEYASADHFVIQTSNIRIEYVYKPNGGLYTGYNVAYQTIQTELCVCIDSDDYMPDDAVAKILALWIEKGGENVCGLVGLDFDVRTKEPIGGYFKETVSEFNALEMNHVGDTKYVFRTELIRQVAPQIGFEGERDFNPHYMQMQVLDKYSILVLNDNLCWVEYQIGGDSMSQAIWKQYIRSPRSYAKYRITELQMQHGNTLKNKFRLCTHYVSSCMLSKDGDWLKNSPDKLLTLLASPFGALLCLVVNLKNRK